MDRKQRDSDLDTVLDKWDEARDKIKALEAKIEKYKASVGKLMDRRNTDKLTGRYLNVQRRRGARTYISQKDVPRDIWEKYSSRSQYEAFYLKKNPRETSRRS